MSMLVIRLCCLFVTVSAGNLKMALRYQSHPSLIKHDMKDLCYQYIDLSGDGRNSGGVLSLNIPLEDIASSFSCTTALRAPQNYRVLVALKKMKIPIPASTCSDYITIFNGGLNSTDVLSNKICGYYDDSHSPRLVYYSRMTSSTLSVKVSKQTHEDFNFDFGVTLTFTVFSRSQRGTCLGRDQMLCDNEVCIWKHFRCNDHNNCGDGSDEKQCRNDFPVDKRSGMGSSKAYIIFLGTIMVLILLIMVLVASRFKKQLCFFGPRYPARRTSTEQISRCDVSVVATADEADTSPPPYGYDNSGYVPEPPPSYEEALAACEFQHENQLNTAGRSMLSRITEHETTPTAASM